MNWRRMHDWETKPFVIRYYGMWSLCPTWMLDS